MWPITPATFTTHPNTVLRVWFNDGVQGWQQLSPDTLLASVPYAMSAHVPDGSITGSLLAQNTIDPSRLAIAGTAATGRLLSYNGTGFSWADLSVVNTNWIRSGNTVYYNAGNVGIGTAATAHRLGIAGGPFWTGSTWLGALGLENAAAIGWAANASGQRFGMGHSGGGFYMFRTTSDLGDPWSPALYDFAISDTGNVGVGTTTPTSKLDIDGPQDALKITGYQPILTMRDSSFANARSVIQAVNGGLNLFTERYLAGQDLFGFMRLDTSGNVGIGSAAPVSKLEVVAAQDALRLIGFEPFLTLFDSGGGYAASRIQAVKGTLVFQTHDYINSGGNGPGYAVLNRLGNLSVGTLTIRGGADLAEPFAMGNKEIPKGSVVVIDSKNPGRLKLSDRAYDQRVAGVVSGANGINPGIALHQEGALDQGQNVALTGRVYVQADASHGAIEPGDLLTTSDTPGHAMKVSDSAKAQGAILGKAMTSLHAGTGMVLVLVTLQ